MGADERLQQFQRNSAYVAFIVFLITCAVVYLTEKLAEVVTPLIWAAFFALPSGAVIASIEEGILACSTAVRNCLRRRRGEPELSPERFFLDIKAVEGEFFVTAEGGEHTARWLDAVNRPFLGMCCGFRHPMLHGCCRRRATLVHLQPTSPLDGSGTLQQRSTMVSFTGFAHSFPMAARSVSAVGHYPRSTFGVMLEANRLEFTPATPKNSCVAGWHYYVKEPAADAEEGGEEAEVAEVAGPVRLRLFLDSACVAYPVTYRAEDRGDDMEASRLRRPERLRGRLEVSRSNTLAWTLAFMVFLLITGLVLVTLGYLISIGCSNFSSNVEYFKQGAKDVADELVAFAQQLLPPDQFEAFKKKVNDYVAEALPSLVASVTSEFQVVLWQGLLFVLYLGFWLSEPLPVNEKVSDLFKAYIMLKTIVCVLFGVSMGLLLLALGNPLWPLVILLTALLNYIPEVGAVLSALICLPAVLLDGHEEMSTRWHNTLMLVIFGSLFKVVTGNIIEVRLYASTGGQFMRMHPVVLMGIMMLCAALLGLTGMFLAIPITATLKYFLLCSDIPPEIVDPVLRVIEGEQTGPYMNAVDSERAEQVARRLRERHCEFGSEAQLAELDAQGRAAGERPLLEADAPPAPR